MNPYTEGGITKGVFRLAWPVMISMALELTFSVIDAIWVGRLGATAVAALSTSGFIIWSLHALLAMISVGINAIVARYIGGNKYNNALYVANQGLRLTFIVSFIVSIGGIWICPALFGIMDTAPDVTATGILYMNVIFGGVLTFFMFYSVEAIFRASGDTRTPMKILMLALLLNAILDPLLIFGIGFFPRWEVMGAGIATVISHLIAIAVAGILLKKRVFEKYKKLADSRDTEPVQISEIPVIKCDFQIFKKILKIGIPD